MKWFIITLILINLTACTQQEESITAKQYIDNYYSDYVPETCKNHFYYVIEYEDGYLWRHYNGTSSSGIENPQGNNSGCKMIDIYIHHVSVDTWKINLAPYNLSKEDILPNSNSNKGVEKHE